MPNAPDDAAAATTPDRITATSDRKHSGRLELTWTNKDRALLAHDDVSYEWVSPRDHRVAEVRLLHEAGTVGEVHGDDERARDNMLIRGDALHALTALTRLPEFAAEYVGKVKLAYLDPPFNTGGTFQHYDDNLEHSVWLTLMRDRLQQVKTLLSPDGSVWVHCDDYEQHHLRVLMDEVFGRENFVTVIVWQKMYSSKSSARHFSVDQDYVLIYARDGAAWTPNLMPRTEEADARYKNPDNDSRGPWTSGDLCARNFYGEGKYVVVGPTGKEFESPKGSYWRFSKTRFEEMDADDRIWWGATGDNMPRLKRFLSETKQGMVPRTMWMSTEVGHTQESKKEIKRLFPDVEPFDTPKPERFMERIIHLGSNPGDIVLDCFAGSGSTAAVAHKMGRRWVTAEWKRETLDTFIGPRLQMVVEGSDPGGVTESVGWSGGGGFRVLDVAPSMYEDDEGVVVLAEWATNGMLAESVAAQLGFAPEAAPPFCGRHGRMRLAVVDGHVNEEIARSLARALGPGERVSLCGTSLDPDVPALLTKLKPGSAARVVPEDVLVSYTRPGAWRASVAQQPELQGDDAAEAEVPAGAST